MNINRKTGYYLGLAIMLIMTVVVMTGCGSSSPTSAGRFVSGNTNPAMLTVTVNFPTRPAAYMTPQPLISASTLLMDIGVYATNGTLIGSGAVSAPPAGGTASTSIKIYQYEGPVYVDVIGYNTPTVTPPMLGYIGGVAHNQPMTGYVQQTGLNIAFASTTPVSMVFVEGDQGVTNITGMNVVSPDGTTYIVNDIFLLFTGSFGQKYELAAKLTNASTGAISYRYSAQNPDLVSFKSLSWITNASVILSLEIPTADKKTWNRYDYNLNFAPLGTPTNTPTITQTFMGTIANTNGTVVNNYAIGWTGSKYLVGGANSGMILTSPDANTWTSQNTAATFVIRAIASGSSNIVAGDDTGNVIVSPDGVTWTSSWLTAGTFDIIWTGANYIAVEQWGYIDTSPDGIIWTTQWANADDLHGVAWSPTLARYVSVGSSLGAAIVYTSSDAVTWTQQAASTTSILNKVTWSGTQFVSVGDTGAIITSPDGITWTPRTSGTINNLTNIVWSGTQFVAVGVMGTILTSPDGITWTPRTSGTSANLNGVVWGGTQFVVAGDAGIILTSPDGITWTPKNVWSQGSNFNLPNAAWSNYVAPPPPNVQTVVF